MIGLDLRKYVKGFMNTGPVKKENLVCVFHEPFEKDLCRMKRRLDILILITIVNALLTGAHLVLKIPLIL